MLINAMEVDIELMTWGACIELIAPYRIAIASGPIR